MEACADSLERPDVTRPGKFQCSVSSEMRIHGASESV